MRFAFALFRYFPFGGLQRDMLRIAESAAERKHQVDIFCGSWQGEKPKKANIRVIILPIRGFENHVLARNFEIEFLKAAANGYDVTFAFNRFGGTDVYFATDNCYAMKVQKRFPKWFLNIYPHYQTYLRQEREIFEQKSNTRILYITPAQKRDFQAEYHTPDSRFTELPPGMNPACIRPEDAEEKRKKKRSELGFSDDEIMLILAGSDLFRKGGDRLLLAVNNLPENLQKKCRIFFAGQYHAAKFISLAKKLNLTQQTTFAGGRNDIPELLLQQDLMVHPARDEAAGSILIEGIAAGLPVLCTEECGFSKYVKDASGLVLPGDASQEDLNAMLLHSLNHLPEIIKRTRDYSKNTDFRRRADVAVDVLEEIQQNKKRISLL